MPNTHVLNYNFNNLTNFNALRRKTMKKQTKNSINQDPVCGKRINRNKAHITVDYKDKEYLLCCPLCQAEFEKDPEKYLR
jgi:YHS domain-containing protein